MLWPMKEYEYTPKSLKLKRERDRVLVLGTDIKLCLVGTEKVTGEVFADGEIKEFRLELVLRPELKLKCSCIACSAFGQLHDFTRK